MQPKVSIIIPHFNGEEILTECLDNLKNATYPDIEIIVVNNASTDSSTDFIRDEYPNINLIENDQNLGYAGGCNQGSEQAQGKYLIFLNNDTIQEPGWIEPLVSIMERKPQVAAIQPKILNYYHKDRFDYAGGAGGAMDILCYPFARGRLFLSQENDFGQYDDATSVFWASGTAIMVRKDIFEKAGRFDELFFAHMEEIDLCWRFHLMGSEVWCEPKSLIYHKNAMTLPMFSLKKYYLNHRNSLIMISSNFSLPVTLYLFLFRYVLEWVALAYSFSKLDWPHIGGIIKAHLWLFVHPYIIYKKRKHVKSIRVKKDRFIMRKMYQGSIVLTHYLGRKKTYGDITDIASS